MFHLDAGAAVPLYRQVYQQVREAILRGELPAGSRLPPSRELARSLGVGRISVTAAYRQLQAEGYVISRVGAGTFVAPNLPATHLPPPQQAVVLSPWGQRVLSSAPTAATLAPRCEIDFGFGRPFASIFPYHVWRRLLARYLSSDDALLGRYGSAAGFFPLRQAIADYVARQRGVRCTAEQVVIVNGAQQAVDMLARLLLTPGDEVLVETPGYVEVYELLRLHGARLVGVAVDEAGLPAEQLPAASPARLVFVTPAHQFPKGGAMPLTRRLALLQWARENGAFILEDDYDSELRYTGHPLPALQGLDESGQVVYLGTFSKVLFPALRLGYVVLPPALCPPFIQAKQATDRGAPTLTQAAVADFISEGHFERHLRALRRAYGRRRAALVTALEQYLPGKVGYAPDAAGLHVMLYLAPGVDEERVVSGAAAVGVGVYSGARYHLAGGQGQPPPSILLGFSGLNQAEIVEGVRRLAGVIGSLAAGDKG